LGKFLSGIPMDSKFRIIRGLLKIHLEFQEGYNEKLSGIPDHKEVWGKIAWKFRKIS
jgi:hypothetical protein